MDIIRELTEKGYLYQSDEPGFFLHCADEALAYQTWDLKVMPLPEKPRAPFGMIFAKQCTPKGAKHLFDTMRRNWNELNHDPEVLILTTSKCNLNCPYCIVGVQKAEKFSFPSIEQVEKAFRLFPVKRVVITGGEPLAEKEQFVRLLEWLIGKVERCDVLSNGLDLDAGIWPLLARCAGQMELWVRLTLSESLAHMKLAEVEQKILPHALEHPQVRMNLSFLPNHDGTGLKRFLRRINELKLPEHITVTPSYLTESKVSERVEFDIANYLREMMEVAEHGDEYLGHVNFDPGKSFYLLVNELQLLGCKRRTITLSDQGYALCNIFHCEGKVFKGPLEAAAFIWERLVRVCMDCKHYPDHCQEAIGADECERFKLGCNRCPLIYLCALRCPYAFETEKDLCVGQTDLQCLGYPLLRIFANWLMYRKKNWQDISQEIKPAQNMLAGSRDHE